MQSRYDFILFENFHHAHNHRFDVVLIARMLRYQGLKVAILNVYDEYNCNNLDGIPVIDISMSSEMPNDKWFISPKNKVHSFLSTLRFLFQQHIFMCELVEKVEPLADRFYCGSYHDLMSSSLLKFSKPCYFWGLRSWTMTGFWKKFLTKPIYAFKTRQLKRTFINNDNCRLFVSNEIILQEFLKLGIPNNRMVIRQERCVESYSEKEETLSDYKDIFLVIGKLRKEKNIPIVVKAFNNAKLPGSKLLLVGQSDGSYEETIKLAIEGSDNIERVNKYLEYDNFLNYFKISEFVLFADEQGNSCITNGTMVEALMNHRPVICPNYLPFSYYIEKFHFGLTYDPMDVDSFTRAIRNASSLGARSFNSSIDAFLRTISFDKVSKRLVDDIYATE